MRALWMSMLFASVGVFGPSMALAERTCEDVFGDEYAANGRIKVESSALHGPKAKDYELTLQKIDLLLEDLKAPTETNVVVHDLMMFSSFHPVELVINVGLRPDTNSAKMNPRVNLTTLIHEYGHAILEKNLTEQLPGFKEFHHKQYDDMSEINPKFILSTALHEFFADTVTLVATKNPQALPEVLSDPTYQIKTNTMEDFWMRSMRSPNRESYKKWRELMDDSISRQDPYLMLTPTRWHLGKLVIAKIEEPRFQRRILSLVFPIIKAEMEANLRSAPHELSAAEVEALNQRIMRKLDDVLQ